MKKILLLLPFLSFLVSGIQQPMDMSDSNAATIFAGSPLSMSRNLNVTTYRNGDVIPQVTDPGQWDRLTSGAWCYYNNNPALEEKYGKLYNWYAVNDPRGLAPAGWHIPNEEEMYNLMYDFPVHNSDFVALPGGFRSNAGNFEDGERFGYWWTSTELSYSPLDARTWDWEVGHNGIHPGFKYKKYGLSVSCIKN